MGQEDMLSGYKSQSYMEASYVFAPYVPLEVSAIMCPWAGMYMVGPMEWSNEPTLHKFHFQLTTLAQVQVMPDRSLIVREHNPDQPAGKVVFVFAVIRDGFRVASEYVVSDGDRWWGLRHSTEIDDDATQVGLSLWDRDKMREMVAKLLEAQK